MLIYSIAMLDTACIQKYEVYSQDPNSDGSIEKKEFEFLSLRQGRI